MSNSSTAFAIDQHNLPPNAQLALIIISDVCGNYFSLRQAELAVLDHTSISIHEIDSVMQILTDGKLLIPCPLDYLKAADGEATYVISEVRS